MMEEEYDPDGRLSLDMKSEKGLRATLEGAGTEETRPDIISDPGVEGGVDAPNESTEEPDTEN